MVSRSFEFIPIKSGVASAMRLSWRRPPEVSLRKRMMSRALTYAMGDSPFMISLDASKKKAAVRTDFSNDKKLGGCLPFGTAALKRCP